MQTAIVHEGFFNDALTAGSGAWPDTDVQAHRTGHLLLQLLDACQPA